MVGLVKVERKKGPIHGFHKIDGTQRVDEKNNIHWLDLEIDNHVFSLNRQDCIALFFLLEPVVDTMLDSEEAYTPDSYHRIVMENCRET